MATAYHIDFETFSCCPLGGKDGLGQYRYASDPSTEILFCAISKDEPDAPVHLWVNPQWEVPRVFESDPLAISMIAEAAEWGFPIYAHNAPFEAAVSKYLFKKTFGVDCPKLEQWRCTAAMARRAAIPSSLEKVGAFLKLRDDLQKDKRGKALIKKFSEPIKAGKRKGERFLPSEDLEAFIEFGEYCRQDVVTEKAVHKALAAFELTGEVLEAFQFDMRMNDRGIPVNLDALKEAERLVLLYTEEKAKEFQELTGLQPTQNVAFLEWVQGEGYPGNNLQKATVDNVLEQDPDALGISPKAVKALKLRADVTFAAVKKISKMRACACPDGRVRGALIWSGAERTHRWAGSLIQPQNFRRPTVKGTELAYSLICRHKADPETFEALFGPFPETIASCIRHFIHPDDGFLDSDYSAIEARVNPWLCGQEDTLELFRKGEPIYEIMASRIYQVPVQEVGKKSIERFLGKQAVLGCLAEGTKVLTKRGWVNIEKTETNDLVWDGVEWVGHKGKIFQGTKETLNLSGLWLTPDHKILCGDQWQPAFQVQNENSLSRALEKGQENLPLQASLKAPGAVVRRSLSNAIATGKSTGLNFITSKNSVQHAAPIVQGRKGRKHGKIIGSIRRLSQMIKSGSGFLIAFLPKLGVATTPGMHNSKTMVQEGLPFANFGGKTGQNFLNTAKPSKGGKTQVLKLTALTLMAVTARGTFGLFQKARTPEINGQSFNFNLKSIDSGKRIRTYDLSFAGPRNRFTVLTNEGPIIVHNCGYNMGVDKFRETCRSYGQEISQGLAEKAVYTWRKVHPIIVDCWRSIDDAAKMAIHNPGKIYDGTPRTGRIRFGMTSKAGFPALVMILPSGHKLIYPKAKVVPNWSVFVNRKANKFASYAAAVEFCNVEKIDLDQIREGSEISYWGKLPDKGGTQWGWLSTYGGKLLENATQAVAGDIMTNGALNAEKAGFDIAMLVHDQALALFRQGQDHEDFSAALCELPAWADGLPVEAEGGFCKFYQKD